MSANSKDPWDAQQSGERQAWLIGGALILVSGLIGGVTVKIAIDRLTDGLSEAIEPAGEAFGKTMGKALINTGLEIGWFVEDLEQEQDGVIPPGTAVERRAAGNE